MLPSFFLAPSATTVLPHAHRSGRHAYGISRVAVMFTSTVVSSNCRCGRRVTCFVVLLFRLLQFAIPCLHLVRQRNPMLMLPFLLLAPSATTVQLLAQHEPHAPPFAWRWPLHCQKEVTKIFELLLAPSATTVQPLAHHEHVARSSHAPLPVCT